MEGQLRDHTEFTRGVLLDWGRDADLWRRRSAIIAQLKFKADTDLELLLAAIEPAMESNEFFLRKAIGWACVSTRRPTRRSSSIS